MLHQPPSVHALWTISYCSQVRGRLGRGELLRLVQRAHIKNAVLGVTGVVFFDGEHFIQILEGPTNDLITLYEEIAADPRHMRVAKGLDEAIGARRFAEWSMRLVGEEDLLARARSEIRLKMSTIDPRGDRFERLLPPADVAACSRALIGGVVH
jgi:hypothetical protein